MRAAFALTLLGACEWGGGPGPGPSGHVADAKMPDAKVFKDAGIDTRPPDAMIDAPADPTRHVVMSEIAVAPDGAEFIELYNPTGQAVDLSQYYLSNHGSYWKLPVAGQAIPFAHFIVQFPAGASLAAGAAITVATQGAAPFMAFYNGTAPTYSITDGTMINTVVSNTPRLTDGGATVILFQWDGASGLVKDVDIMVVGVPSATNVLIDKSGTTQLGMTYATDANSIPTQPSSPGISQSTKRKKLELGNETATGGNGLTGHDETSEHTDVTWDTSFSAPTPNVVPALQ